MVLSLTALMVVLRHRLSKPIGQLITIPIAAVDFFTDVLFIEQVASEKRGGLFLGGICSMLASMCVRVAILRQLFWRESRRRLLGVHPSPRVLEPVVQRGSGVSSDACILHIEALGDFPLCYAAIVLLSLTDATLLSLLPWREEGIFAGFPNAKMLRYALLSGLLATVPQVSLQATYLSSDGRSWIAIFSLTATAMAWIVKLVQRSLIPFSALEAESDLQTPQTRSSRREEPHQPELQKERDARMMLEKELALTKQSLASRDAEVNTFREVLAETIAW